MMREARAPWRRGEGGDLPARSVLLQRCACGSTQGPAGECAECRRKRLLQPRLVVNAPGDRYEREADRVAAQVMRAGETGSASRHVQRLGGNAARAGAEAPPVVDEVLRAPGRPLDAATQAFMSARLGHDFSRVRVHDDAQAAASARAVGALAYTVGQDVVFGAGQFAPGTPGGQRLLAHELVHTIQQQGLGGEARQAATVQRTEGDGTYKDAPTEEGDCSGWLSDPESFSIVIAKTFLRDEAPGTNPGLVKRVVCERTSTGPGRKRPWTWDRCFVHFADGTVVRVVLFSEMTAIVTRINPPADWFCHYTFSCRPDGSLVARRYNCPSLSLP